MIDLKPFCDEKRSDWLKAPFTEAGYTFATNGHILVRVARREDVPELKEPHLSPLLGVFERWAGSSPAFMTLDCLKRVPLKECGDCLGEGRVIPCETCGGEGGVECGECHHVSDCEDCDGKGHLCLEGFGDETIAEKAITCPECLGRKQVCEEDCVSIAAGHHFNPRFLLLIDALPNARLALGHAVPFEARSDSADAAYFTFDGGDGLIMPMRPQDSAPKLYDEPSQAEAA